MTPRQLLLVPCAECGLDSREDGASAGCRTCQEALGYAELPDDGESRYERLERVSDRVEAVATWFGGRWP